VGELPKSDPPYYRKPRTTFQPRFTLSIFYLFGLFFVYCLLLVSPSLIDVIRNVPTGPEQQAIAKEIVRESVRPRLWIAMLLSAVTTTLGAHYRVLPGLRERR
jgi:hypothetical protein